MTNAYDIAHERSLRDPEGFWGDAAADIHWYKRWDRVLDDSNPPFYRWFAGGSLNTCYNCVDRHVEAGRGAQTAIIYDSPVTNIKRRISYAELLDLVERFAGTLTALGVGKGDRVIIYMPMVPEAVIAMLGCARIGAIHGVVFGGFAARELAVRINDAQPKLVVSASCGIETGRVIPYKPLLDEAIEISAHKPSHCLILERPQQQAAMTPGRDLSWAAALAAATPAPCTPVAATDPLYILYTSGTTGDPKGIVRDNGGHAVALSWTMKNIYNAAPGEVYWAASDIGWVVGHSYIVYAPLLIGATTVVYEGKPVGTPDAGAFWRMVSEYKIQTLFTAPTAFRAIKREDPEAKLLKDYDISSLRALFLAGERSDPDTIQWAERYLGVPVVDHWWQTETGWAIAANCLGLNQFPVRYGSPTKAVPGWNIQVIADHGGQAEPGEQGPLVAKLPLPPGTLATLWQRQDRFSQVYLDPFPGYYLSGDAGYIDADGYIYVMARTDDIINIAGHRLSTGAIEEVLSAHPDVAECAVFGVADQLKGQVPFGLLVLKTGVTRRNDQIIADVVQMVRDRIGAVAGFRTAVVVKRLPKTRSGKTLRGTMQKIADNQAFKMPATIDDPAILTEIEEAMEAVGYGHAREKKSDL